MRRRKGSRDKKGARRRGNVGAESRLRKVAKSGTWRMLVEEWRQVEEWGEQGEAWEECREDRQD